MSKADLLAEVMKLSDEDRASVSGRILAMVDPSIAILSRFLDELRGDFLVELFVMIRDEKATRGIS